MSDATPLAPVNLRQKASLLPGIFQPRVIAELNDYQFKIARTKGEFVWHEHADTDEAFLVVEGSIEIDMPDGVVVSLSEGDLFVVPRGVRHRPRAAAEATVLLIEPRGVVNTGAAGGPLTAPLDEWI